MNHKKAMSSAITYGVLVLITIVCLFPIVWMCLISIKDTSESITGFNSILVTHPTLGNFKRLFEMIPVGQNTFNSVFTTIMGTVTSLFFCALAGFAFAKYKFKGKEFFFMIVLSTLMIPLQVTMIPVFVIASKLGIRNTLWGVIIPPCAEALGLFLSRQFISDIPDGLLEAGRIDGASEFTIFTKTILPNVKPLISVLVIFTVMWRWNDLQWPLIMLSNEKFYTVQLGLSNLNGAQYVNWNDMMAASLISVIPVLTVFLIFQKQFVQGVASSGIKG